jgi:hypothetical protein
MPLAVNADTPDNKSDAADQRGRVSKPQSHLGLLDTGVSLGQADDEPVAETARAEDLRDEGADDETEEEKTLALGRIGFVGNGDEGDDAENPPIPGWC